MTLVQTTTASWIRQSQRRRLERAFFARDAAVVAPELVGKTLVRRWRGRHYAARVVETEAYVGPHDLACHASKGRTARTEVMFGPPGHAYVYLIYGMHQMLNVVVSHVGDAQAILIRAAEPLDGWDANLTGPGRLARALRVTSAENGVDLTGGRLFFLEPESAAAPAPRLVVTRRVNVDYAGAWKDEPLRFYDGDSPAVSKPR
jgi:DNA-3-methyladenine glycosylase